MFKGNIKSYTKYAYLNDKFEKALKWFAETDLESLEIRNYEIEGKDIYANVQEYESYDWKECEYESHKDYIDIQYVVKGEEFFGYCPQKELVTSKPYVKPNDVEFYHDPKDIAGVALHEGDFIMVTPEEAHKPRVTLNKKTYVKKIVLKVKI